jgi:hypothetical protein
MIESGESLDQELERLARATDGVHPRGGFNQRVMLRVLAEQPGLVDDLWSAARRLVPVAVLAAVLGLVWAVEGDRSVDDALALSDDTVELSW